MEFRRMGRSGLKLSVLSFGSWVTFGPQLDEERALRCMQVAFDAGVNFFDNAEVYSNGESERLMGRALKRAGWRRSDLVISTKLFWGGEGPNDVGLSRKHLVEGLHASLARLQLDYVDILFCHRPDLETPIEETVWAMHQLVQRGLAIYWGTSEWSAEQIEAAIACAKNHRLIGPTVEQPQYNLFHRARVEQEYARLYREHGIGTTIWSPLASGLLSGKYSGGKIPAGSRATLAGYEWLRDRLAGNQAQERAPALEQLKRLAEELRGTLAQLAIAWCAKNPDVSSVILGASRVEQLEENLGALALLPKLDAARMEQIDQILGNRPAPERNWR